MKTRGKRILRIGAIVLAAVLLLVIACSLYVYFHKATLKGFLEKSLSKKDGLTVVIGRLNYRIFPLRVEAEAVKIVFVTKFGRADVWIDRAEASGSLRRLINNQKPIFDSLAVSGLKTEFAALPNAPPSGPVSLRDLARMVSESLEYVRDLIVKDASLHLRLPAQGMDLSAAGASLKAAAADSSTLRLSVTRLDVRNDNPKCTLTAGLRCEATWTRTDPFSLQGILDLTNALISFPEKRWEGPAFSLKADFRAGGRSVAVSAITLDSPNLVALSGSGLAEWDQNARVTITTKLNIHNLERAKKAFSPFLPPGLPVFSLDGSAQWEGDVRWETASGAARIYVNGSLRVPRLGTIGLSGDLGLSAPRQVNLALRSRNLDIGDILKYFPAFVPDVATAWKPGGKLDLALEIRNEPSDSGRYRVKGTGDLSKVAFQDSSGVVVSEGLEPRLKFEADILSFDKTIPFSLQLDLAKGESLWNDAYFNWRSEPVRLELKGMLDPRLRQVNDAVAVVFFSPLGEVRAVGALGFGPNLRSDVHLAAPSIGLASLHAFFMKMRPGRPSTWEIQGTAEAEVDIRLDTSFRVRGRARIHEAAARQKDGSLSLGGINADFPFLVSRGARAGDEKTDDSLSPGRILIQEIKTPVAEVKALRVDFYSTRNLFLLFPIEIGLWGSRLELGQSVLAINPQSREIRGVSNLTLTDLDFSNLPFNSESFKLVGRASIPTCELEIRADEFRLRGRLLADIFGGRLTMDDLRITEAFSTGRKISFQAEIGGLDLGKLTDSVPFGEVTGIVDVSLRDVALSYGQPENFILSIISVPRKGVSRKFSMKAVNNLSVISSNGPPAVPSSNLLTKLVNSFGYSGIGIACSLKNDVFALQGTIVEGGIQYLVRRSTFFGIDVVNGNPVNKIGFQDMLDRLKRIGQSQEKK